MERMWKRWRGEIFRAVLIVADLVALGCSFVTAYWLRYRAPGVGAMGTGPGLTYYGEAMLAACIVWIGVLSAFGLYQLRRGWRISDLIFTSVYAVSVATVVFLAVAYMLHMISYSRLLIGYLWVVNASSVVGVRVAAKLVLRKLSAARIGVRRLAVVGDNGAARTLIKTISLHPELGYEVVGLLKPERAGERQVGPVFVRAADAAGRFAAWQVDDVIVTLPPGRNDELGEFICRCQELGIKVRILPDLYENYSSHMPSEPIENIPLLVPRHQSLALWERAVKRVGDLAGATVLLVPGIAVGLILATRRWLVGGAAIVEWEERVGQDGVSFSMYRFAPPCAGSGGPSAIGRIMLRYSLTEVPQLWNVIKGEMSLVGPRPEARARVERYNRWHRRRLMLKPGITGLAQVNGLRGFSSTDEKTRFDLEYLEHQSPSLDARILLQTLWTLAQRPGETAAGSTVLAEEAELGELGDIKVSQAGVGIGGIGRC